MKLTKSDKEMLMNLGHPESDLEQIEKATGKTKYKYEDEHGCKKINQKEVLELIGRAEYLKAISRSAFHYTTAREIEKGKIIYFDSSMLFKNWYYGKIKMSDSCFIIGKINWINENITWWRLAVAVKQNTDFYENNDDTYTVIFKKDGEKWKNMLFGKIIKSSDI